MCALAALISSSCRSANFFVRQSSLSATSFCFNSAISLSYWLELEDFSVGSESISRLMLLEVSQISLENRAISLFPFSVLTPPFCIRQFIHIR